MVRENPVPSVVAVGRAFLTLGLTSFGGPVAHIGYFRAAFVQQRRWLDEAEFAALTALCQALPGPSSSQLGIAIGLRCAGAAGALVAWLAFTLPSALLMTALALVPAGRLSAAAAMPVHGLKLLAVVVVAHAVIGMARALTPDPPRVLVAAVAAALVLLMPGAPAQLAALAGGALAGLRWSPRAAFGSARATAAPVPGVGRGLAAGGLLVLLGLATGFALAGGPGSPRWVQLAAACFTSGALVFGGGHVVLPLLGTALVDPGLLPAPDFLAGYGAAQLLPGPLFAIGAFAGARVLADAPWVGAALGLTMLFLPGILLLFVALPGWAALVASHRLQRALAGVNAAVVGLLAAALYDPLALGTLVTPADGLIALVGLLVLSRLGGGARGVLAALALCVGGALLDGGVVPVEGVEPT